MQGNGQDPGVIPEDRLGSIAVVGIYVDIDDPLRTTVEKPLDGQRGVVVDAESAGFATGSMVHAAGKVDHMQGTFGQHCLGRLERTSSQAGTGLMDIGESRGVLRAQPAFLVDFIRMLAGVLDR